MYVFIWIIMGSIDSAVVQALSPNQCPLGLIAAWCHVVVEFVVSSLAPTVFLLILLFSFLHKNQHLQISNSTRIENLHENQLRLVWLTLWINIIFCWSQDQVTHMPFLISFELTFSWSRDYCMCLKLREWMIAKFQRRLLVLVTDKHMDGPMAKFVLK